MATQKPANVDPFGDDGEWEDVPAETQIRFDTNGDVLTGTFIGWSETDSGIAQAHFMTDEHGEVFVNCGWDLKRQLKMVKKGTLTRVTRTGERDTGQKTPMIEFRVQTKK